MNCIIQKMLKALIANVKWFGSYITLIRCDTWYARSRTGIRPMNFDLQSDSACKIAFMRLTNLDILSRRILTCILVRAELKRRYITEEGDVTKERSGNISHKFVAPQRRIERVSRRANCINWLWQTYRFAGAHAIPGMFRPGGFPSPATTGQHFSRRWNLLCRCVSHVVPRGRLRHRSPGVSHAKTWRSTFGRSRSTFGPHAVGFCRAIRRLRHLPRRRS